MYMENEREWRSIDTNSLNCYAILHTAAQYDVHLCSICQ